MIKDICSQPNRKTAKATGVVVFFCCNLYIEKCKKVTKKPFLSVIMSLNGKLCNLLKLLKEDIIVLEILSLYRGVTL